MIEVKTLSQQDPMRFEVTIRDGSGATRHGVSMSAEYCGRLGGGDYRPEAIIEAAFRFLLDREPKESILSSFDVTIIAQYFPEFERKIADYLQMTPRGAGGSPAP